MNGKSGAMIHRSRPTSPNPSPSSVTAFHSYVISQFDMLRSLMTGGPSRGVIVGRVLHQRAGTRDRQLLEKRIDDAEAWDNLGRRSFSDQGAPTCFADGKKGVRHCHRGLMGSWWRSYTLARR